MVAMQGDTHSLYGTFVVPALVQAASTTTLGADEQELMDALEAWQFSCPTGLEGTDPVASPKSADPIEAAESIGCTAFHTVFFAIVEAALGDETAAAGLELPDGGFGLTLVARALHDPTSLSSGDALWDDVTTTPAVESRDEILLRAITRAASVLAPLGGADEWRWGRVHTLILRSIYDNFGFDLYNEGPYAASGGLFTVNVANPKKRALPESGMPLDLGFTSGASIRLVTEARPTGPRMRFQLPGGADLHRESPFYNNLLPRWLDNEPVDFAFGPGGVKDPEKVVDVSPAP
jgi:penicillin G amidase